ncbi:glutathione S-transferase-like [Pelodytes ibericus]
MCDKPKLHYFNGRGRMESIRWLLASVDVEFDEEFVETREQYEKLLNDGSLLFQQMPMVEMDGMKLVQTKAILQYIADKYNMHGTDPKEKVLIDIYVDGTTDLMALVLSMFFMPKESWEKQKTLIKDKALNRFLPVYENGLQNQEYLVGNKFSWADVHLLEAIFTVEEIHPDILLHFPQLKAFKERISKIPTIKKFLQPGSQRKPIADEHYIATVRKILQF